MYLKVGCLNFGSVQDLAIYPIIRIGLLGLFFLFLSGKFWMKSCPDEKMPWNLLSYVWLKGVYPLTMNILYIFPRIGKYVFTFRHNKSLVWT